MLKKTILAGIFALASSLSVSSLAAQPVTPGASFDVAFSPNKGSLDLVLKAIGSAKSELLVAAYSFTSKPIAEAILAASKRGVKVGVIADQKDNQKQYSAVTFLANNGVAVRLDGNYAIFHHKFMVIDRKTVETGSFNYSAAAANKNAENVIVLWNAPDIATVYVNQFSSLWGESTPVAPNYR